MRPASITRRYTGRLNNFLLVKEWALNAAAISQYYLGLQAWAAARHCLGQSHLLCRRGKFSLACSNAMLDKAAAKDEDEAAQEDRIQKEADVAICWVKYYQHLLEAGSEVQDPELEKLTLVHFPRLTQLEMLLSTAKFVLIFQRLLRMKA